MEQSKHICSKESDITEIKTIVQRLDRSVEGNGVPGLKQNYSDLKDDLVKAVTKLTEKIAEQNKELAVLKTTMWIALGMGMFPSAKFLMQFFGK